MSIYTEAMNVRVVSRRDFMGALAEAISAFIHLEAYIVTVPTYTVKGYQHKLHCAYRWWWLAAIAVRFYQRPYRFKLDMRTYHRARKTRLNWPIRMVIAALNWIGGIKDWLDNVTYEIVNS